MRQVAGLGRFGFKPRSWVREVCLHRGFLFFIFEFGQTVSYKTPTFVFSLWAKRHCFGADLSKIEHINKMMCHLTTKSNQGGRIANRTKIYGVKSKF